MWSRNEVPMACCFPKQGSGRLLFSGAREKLDQGSIVLEDPRRGTETTTAKRRNDGLTPPLGPATQLHLELILFDDRRCGAETKYRWLAAFRSKVALAYTFPEHGKIRSGVIIVLEDPRCGTETKTAKRHRKAITSGVNCFRRPEVDKQLNPDIIASQTKNIPARIDSGFNFFRVPGFGPCP